MRGFFVVGCVGLVGSKSRLSDFFENGLNRLSKQEKLA